MQNIVTNLRQRLPEGAVLTGAEIGERYNVDFSHENAIAPLAVLRPSSTAEVALILAECDRARQRVVVQGGLTGLAGGATPQDGEIAISLERLSGIEEIDHAAQTMTVRAGTALQTVQQAAADAGFLFPLDLGARGSCTIGGNIATNAGGNQVIRFGMMRNLVLGLEAVLADGTVVSSLNKMLKNNAGYDLKQLFIGSEGTLGVVTRAVLRLWPKLPNKVTALCALPGFDEAVTLLHTLQAQLGSSLSAFEAMWPSYFHYVLDRLNLPTPFGVQHAAVRARRDRRRRVGERSRAARGGAGRIAAGESHRRRGGGAIGARGAELLGDSRRHRRSHTDAAAAARVRRESEHRHDEGVSRGDRRGVRCATRSR